MTVPFISLKDVDKSYTTGLTRQKIIRTISLSIEKGEVFGFIGPNGAGKSTLINLLMGFIDPDRGQITIDGVSSHRTEARANIGYLPEDPRFYRSLTAQELLSFGGRASGLPGHETQKRIGPILERLELGRVRRRPIHTYSKGMKQRIGLALAMIHDPDIYILDEPMSGLDPLGRNLLKTIILELKTRGKTVFFSTHILNDVEVLCDRIGIIHKGKIRFCGQFQDFAPGKQGFEAAFVDLITHGE